jgi:hypothetical protein
MLPSTVDTIIERWRPGWSKTSFVFGSEVHTHVLSGLYSHAQSHEWVASIFFAEKIMVPCWEDGRWLLLILRVRRGLPSTITVITSDHGNSTQACVAAWRKFLSTPSPNLMGWPFKWVTLPPPPHPRNSNINDGGAFLLYNLAAEINPDIRTGAWPTPATMLRRLAVFLLPPPQL